MLRLTIPFVHFLPVVFFIAASGPAWGLDASLSASTGFPAPLGTPVRFTAAVSDADDGGEVWYRFRVKAPGGEYRTIRDFGPETDLDWSAWEREGTYEIEVTTRDTFSGETAANTLLVEMEPRALGTAAAVSATRHPLVFLYSAPPCNAGEQIRVQFHGPDGAVRETPRKGCDPAFTTNFYIAGLYEKTEYAARHVIDNGQETTTSESISFTSGEAAANLYPTRVVQEALPTATNQILLSNGSGAPTATDLNGAIVWYTTGIEFITRAEQDGHFWTIVEANHDPARNVIRKFDLTGTTVLETNAARVNEQLRAMGKREISGFHHEAVTLPDGRIAALAGVEQILTDVQGPGPVDVLGDMIVVLDSELNVLWTWDAFDHLDVRRPAILGQTCTRVSSGCAPTYLADVVNDWTHGNSIQPTPDGNLLFSARHQDWLIKINYANGTGDGSVMWRLGQDGDFRIISDDPSPWFSHQHDGNFDPSDPASLLVFDNGNTRMKAMGGGFSRGQVLKLDEVNRTATLTLNADLGVASLAVGSAQKLSNGNYHFDAGFVTGPDGLQAFSVEVDPTGKIVYNATLNNLSYRSFRLIDMYTPN